MHLWAYWDVGHPRKRHIGDEGTVSGSLKLMKGLDLTKNLGKILHFFSKAMVGCGGKIWCVAAYWYSIYCSYICSSFRMDEKSKVHALRRTVVAYNKPVVLIPRRPFFSGFQ